MPLMPPGTIQDWAARYLEAGWDIVPLAPGTKIAPEGNWKNLVFTAEDFRPKDNIGLKSIKGIVVVDIDCPEAVACADAFLPPTAAIYGRPSKPRSKRIYRSADFTKIIALKDANPEMGGNKATLIEVRVNHQDMAPPSIHPDGEVLAWEAGQHPMVGQCPEVGGPALLRAVRLCATASLIARYYNPEGNRHEWCLALAGTLRGLGLTESEALLVLREAAKVALDGKLDDRLTEVRATYAHPEDDPITGAKTLKELTRSSDTLPKSLGKVWGTSTASGGGIWVMDRKGEVILRDCQENIRKALEKLKVEVSFDEFLKKPMITFRNYNGVMQDNVIRNLWLEVDRQYRFRSSKDFFFDMVQDMAEEKPFHPIRTYLDALVWDGVPRLDEWVIRGAQAADTPYVRAASSLPLIAAVRRVRTPGAKFDEMLIMESGQQGIGKSTALRQLCPNDDWFSDSLPLDSDAKEICERTVGKWIIECSDLAGLNKSQTEHLKQMMSAQVDGPVRMAYARMAVEQPRQFVMIGTTNSHHYLTDPTGNRRFWPVRVKHFDLKWLREVRDQLWAEASHRETAGESIRLPEELYGHAALQQDRRRTGDPWEAILAQEYDGDYYRLTPDEVFMVLGIPRERQDERAAKRVASAMQQLDFRRITVTTEDKKRVRGWGKGSRLLDAHLEED